MIFFEVFKLAITCIFIFLMPYIICELIFFIQNKKQNKYSKYKNIILK